MRANMWSFDLKSRTWSHRPHDLEEDLGREGHSAVCYGHRMVVFGGAGGLPSWISPLEARPKLVRSPK